MHVSTKFETQKVIKKDMSYSVHSPKPRTLSFSFRMLSLCSPGLASKLAARLIFTPHRRRIKGREYDLWLRATPFLVEFNDQQLIGMSWGFGPTILLVHGWGGNFTQLSDFIKPLIRTGYKVVAFDAPAHGFCHKTQTNAVEFADAINRIADEIEPVKAVIGYSLGAASTIIALDNGLKVERAVILASPYSMHTVIDIFSNSLNLTKKASIRLKERIEKKIGRDLNQISPSSIVPRLTIPSLIIHDSNDTLIPYDQGVLLAKTWSGAQVYTTSGLGHKGLLHDKNLIKKVVRFINY
ncbi:MAG: alpha/beta fold hydrolase [Promethearchaeota archaeon]